MKSEQIVPVSCNKDCGGACALLAHVKDSRIVRITNNPLGGKYLKGCVKGFQMPATVHSDDRIQKPLIRSGARGSGLFTEATWSEALHLVAERLAEIKTKHGNQAILPLGGSGACRGALHHTGRLTSRFLALFGGYTGHLDDYSSAAVRFALPYVLGTVMVGIDPATVDHSNLIVLWGANIADCRFRSETASKIREAKARGVEVIVIDPRQTTTARQLGTQWIPVRPGTDAALMLAVLHVLITEELIDAEFIKKYSTGFDDLTRYILGRDELDQIEKSPHWAEKICGTPAEAIIAFARKYGSLKPAALIPGLSIQRTVGGEESVRLAVALQTATGNFGQIGGSSGSITWCTLPGPKVGTIDVPANPVKAHIPVLRWPDVVIEGINGGYPSDIKAIYNVGGNYLVQGSDIHKSIRAFEGVDFSVCHDYFLTPTAKYCDVVLPTTTFLERDDIVAGAGGNYVFFSNKAVSPIAQSRNDYDIFADLACRLDFEQQFTEGRSEESWLRYFVEESEIPDFDEFKEDGIYWGKEQNRVAFQDFIANTEVHPLSTPSGRIELVSQSYAATGSPSVPGYRGLEPQTKYPLRLVTPKSRFRIHSQNVNLLWCREKERQELWMHRDDASARGLTDVEEVVVTSMNGRVRVPLKITNHIMPGVVSLQEGVWPEFDRDGTDTAGSANVLTSTTPTLPSQGSRTHSVNVKVISAQ